MTTYDLLIDNQKFDTKPTVSDTKKINATIIQHPASVTPQELARLVGDEGRTMVLATMDGKRAKDNMVQQQVVAIDFDNTRMVKTKSGKSMKAQTTGKDYTSVAEIYQDPWIQANAAFMYTTFSHTETWHRFRVVFFLDKPLSNPKQVEMLYTWLMDKYPTADKSAKDASRLFFGGTESLEINFNNVLKTSQVRFDKPETKASSLPPKKASKIPIDKAKQMMADYIERDSEHLQDYNNALSAIWVVAKATKTGEISPVIAQDLVDMLAMDNPEWLAGNREKLREALNTPLGEMKTEYTYAEKIGGQFTNAEMDKTDPISTAKYLVDELDIKMFHDQLYFKHEHHWISDNNKLLRIITRYIDARKTMDNELIHQFRKYSELIEDEFFPIQFRNAYHLENGQVKEGYFESFTPYYLDVDYDPEAYDQHVDDFLNFLVMDRPDLRQVVEDMLGHILMDKGFPHKVFFFIGKKGANGKSTFLEMLNKFVGDLGTNISLENFNDATSVVELEGNLVNIGDDIDANYLDSSSNFKILASGNTIMVRPIYAEPYRMKNKATLIFTANDMPTFKDKTGGIARRLIIIPCDNVVTKADFTIDEKLSTENAKSYLLNLALGGLQQIAANGGKISEAKTINELVGGYLTETNSILLFLAEEGIDEDLPDTSVYKSYKTFCEENGFKPFTKTKFTQELSEHGYDQLRKMRMGKRQKYYVKREEE